MKLEDLDKEISELITNGFTLSAYFTVEELKKFLTVRHCQIVRDHDVEESIKRLITRGEINYGAPFDKVVLVPSAL